MRRKAESSVQVVKRVLSLFFFFFGVVRCDPFFLFVERENQRRDLEWEKSSKDESKGEKL